MRWYEVMLTDEFVQYFSDKETKYFTLVNGEERMERTFINFRYLCVGITSGWNAVRSNQKPLPIYDNITYRRIGKDAFLNDKEANVNLWIGYKNSDWNAEELAIRIVKVFWSRMGGSCEKDFAKRGWLREMMLELQRLHLEEMNNKE